MTDADLVLCTLEDGAIQQISWNTTTAHHWQFRLLALLCKHTCVCFIPPQLTAVKQLQWYLLRCLYGCPWCFVFIAAETEIFVAVVFSPSCNSLL